MSRHGKVIVAMSGGVDSSVAAALLKEQGYQCVGVFMRVGVAAGSPAPTQQSQTVADCWASQPAHVPASRGALKRGCCSVEDALDARAVAGRLGIPFYVLNFQADFDQIIEYFVDEYARARTPNPCVVCNTRLKFGKLLRYADLLDAEFVATGHYARVLRGDVGTWVRGYAEGAGRGTAEQRSGTPDHAISGTRSPGPGTRNPESEPQTAQPSSLWPLGPSTPSACFLARARNLAKDQSYVLFGIRRETLPRCLFPLGEIADKTLVRRIAADLGLKVHDKPESQEICFVPDGNYRRLVEERRPGAVRGGEIRDAGGQVLGKHPGIVGYTIGQRHGLRLAMGRPVYVTGLDAASHTVTVGGREELLRSGLRATHVNWLVDRPVRRCWVPAAVRIRHQHAPASGCVCAAADDVAEVRFDQPQSAITPGQAAVFYDSSVTIVLGGGWIECVL